MTLLKALLHCSHFYTVLERVQDRQLDAVGTVTWGYVQISIIIVPITRKPWPIQEQVISKWQSSILKKTLLVWVQIGSAGQYNPYEQSTWAMLGRVFSQHMNADT